MNKHTFEKSSHFDPSVKVMDMTPDAKCVSPLHRGNPETLCEVQISDLSDTTELNSAYRSLTSFIAERPAATIFAFATGHICLYHKPRLNPCKRSIDVAQYGSEF